MASNIKQIINEFKTITDASTVINTFNFGSLSEINEKPEKEFPAIYIGNIVASTNAKIATNFMPHGRMYQLDLTFWDTFDLALQSTADIQDVYSDLEIKADQWFAEVMRRSIEEGTEFFIENFKEMTGTYISNAHNDKLIGIRYNPLVRTANLACNLGTFNY